MDSYCKRVNGEYMSSIVIHPKDKDELLLISELLKKMGVKSRVLSDTDKEDIALSLLMQEVDREEVVSEDEIFAKLNN